MTLFKATAISAVCLGLILAEQDASAQIKVGGGTVSGSLETTNIYYNKDKGLGPDSAPEDKFGSNSYLKVDYNYGKFSAGLQADGYFPALQGYDMAMYGTKQFFLSTKYVAWQDKNFSARVGDIFEQYGNGLILRTFEDRALGFNNAIEGIRGAYNFGGYVALRAIYGRPRLYSEYAHSQVRGGDLSISLSNIFGMREAGLSLEGSYVNRYESLDERYQEFELKGLTTPNLNMYSGRLNFDFKGFDARLEYVSKSKDIATISASASKGYAYYANLGYHYKGFSGAATFRTLDHMGTMVSLYGRGTGNSLNYIPALTRQYTYLLANLNPYQVNVEGEIGGQLELNYTLRSKSARYRYWTFHVNYSTFYTLNKEQSMKGKHELLWSDINVDVERQWSKSLKTTLLFSRQEWNPSHGLQHGTYVSNIFVGDATYKFDRKKSLRLELQYLYSQEYEKDWMAALAEFNLAPRWSFFVSDMYNHGTTDKHYYNGGFSYTHSRTRIQLSYGRNRAGYICSGGVCRYSPAYTGVNLVLTSSF